MNQGLYLDKLFRIYNVVVLIQQGIYSKRSFFFVIRKYNLISGSNLLTLRQVMAGDVVEY